MHPLENNTFKIILIIILSAFLITISLLSEGYFGGADNVNHYFVSRHSFSYPDLFFYAWGRPFFTFVSSPFAQFGFHGIKLFNVTLAILTAYFAYRTANLLSIRPALPVMVLVCFTPIYMAMIFTAMTEILFGFLLMLGIYLFFSKRYIPMAILFSFLPFTRSEGYVLIPIYILALLMQRKYKAIPFLATGFIVITLAGLFYYPDLLWVIHQFPYPVGTAHEVYTRTGSFYHFFEAYEFIFGLPVTVLIIAGLLVMIIRLFCKDQRVRKNVISTWIMVVLPLLVYFLLHSFLYWRAMGGSMGLIRVMAAVTPLASLIALHGYSVADQFLFRWKWLKIAGFVLLAAVIIRDTYLTYPVPQVLSPEEETVKTAANWLKGSTYNHRELYYTDLNMPFFLGLDRYDTEGCKCHWYFMPNGFQWIDPGDIFFWDAHFGPNECGVPIDTLFNHPKWKLINYFAPWEPWITFGERNYELFIFEYQHSGAIFDNDHILDSIKKVMNTNVLVYKQLFSLSFEHPAGHPDAAFLTSDTVHTGKWAYRMDGKHEYKGGFQQTVFSLPKKGKKPALRFTFYALLSKLEKECYSPAVISFERLDKPFHWVAVNINDQVDQPDRWSKISVISVIPENALPVDVVKIYIWNPAKQVFYVDDFVVETIDLGARSR